jgi:putative peptide zinc metalloprotease protein
VPTSTIAPPLPAGRRAALEALLGGASPAAAAAELGWSAARVVREASAALEAIEAERFAHLDPAARAREIERRFGLTPGPAAPPAAPAAPAPAAPVPAAPAPAAAPALPVPDHPTLHPGVRVEDGPPDADFCVVSDRERAIYLRLKRPQAAFLGSLDGSRSEQDLAADSGSLPAQLVGPLLTRFAQLGLLAGSQPADDERRARVRTSDRTRIQFTFADPDRALDRALPLIRALGSLPALVAAGVLMAAAIVVFAAQADLAALTSDFVSQPLVIVTVVVATLATVMLHELGHAAAVRYHGGHVHRLGFMLFYLAPAMFCDTSDAWRFPRRGQRAAVSLAGIGVQLAATALVVLALLLPVGAGVQAWIALYAFVNFGIGMINLIPLVKLDGYWALVAMLDRPNLRADAAGLVREHARRAVFGLRRAQRPLPAPWAHAAFGLACLVFAPALVVIVVMRYQGWALHLGWIGASAWLLLACLVLAGPARGLVVAVRAAAAERRSAALRGGAIIAGAAALTLGALMLVSLPLTAAGDFVRTSPRAAIVQLPAAQRDHVRAGDAATLTDGSFAAPRQLGGATVTTAPGADGRARLRLAGRVPERAGRAELRGRERPVPLWAVDTYVVPLGRAFGL